MNAFLVYSMTCGVQPSEKSVFYPPIVANTAKADAGPGLSLRFEK